MSLLSIFNSFLKFIVSILDYCLGRKKNQDVDKKLKEKYDKLDQGKEEKKKDNLEKRLNNMF